MFCRHTLYNDELQINFNRTRHLLELLSAPSFSLLSTILITRFIQLFLAILNLQTSRSLRPVHEKHNSAGRNQTREKGRVSEFPPSSLPRRIRSGDNSSTSQSDRVTYCLVTRTSVSCIVLSTPEVLLPSCFLFHRPEKFAINALLR